MKVALSWLKKWVSLHQSPDEVAAILTSLGIEVDYIESFVAPIDHVVVGQITEVSAHPNAERLRVATVFDGTSHWQVVCGASNCRQGLKTVFAKIGAQLPGGFEIKKAKLRGVDSFGMLCALDEIGFKIKSDGIHELSEEAVIGSNAFDWINDPVFILSLTPNLGHCLSVEGIARELAAKLDQPLIRATLPSSSFTPSLSSSIQTKLEAEQVHQFAHIHIKNVKVSPSPAWLKNYLVQAGYRPVNNLVDAGNWLMLEYGRPVHLYDASKLEGNLRVALSREGETIERIDGITQSLNPTMLTVFDQKGPIAIAGVMGSAAHQVQDETTEVILEVAVFDPQSVRFSAKTCQCQSESSRRFERGVDPNSTVSVIEHYIDLLDHLGLQPMYSAIEFAPLPHSLNKPLHDNAPKQIQLTSQDVQRLLGIHMGLVEIATWLQRLGIKSQLIESQELDHLLCTVPSWRHDLTIAADLAEEIMRLLGTQNIPTSRPVFSLGAADHDRMHLISQKVRSNLVSLGLQEVVSLDMIHHDKLIQTQMTLEPLIPLVNPVSSEANVLRPTLLANFLEIVRYNLDQQVFNMSFFELGHVYQDVALKEDRERSVASILLSGQNHQTHWHQEAGEWDFYDLKGLCEALFQLQNCAFSFEPSAHAYLHPAQQGQWIDERGQILAVAGKVHPRLVDAWELETSIFYAEISLKNLVHSQALGFQYRPLPIYPGSNRDWTLTVDESVTYEWLLQQIPTVESLSRTELIGIWRSAEKLGENKKNMTLRFYYRSLEKTLTQQEVESAHSFIKEQVNQKLESVVRS